MFSLVNYEPWNLLNQLHNDVERKFFNGNGDGARLWSPAVDVKTEDDAYVLRADVPGVEPKDIELSAENGVLTVKGVRSEENKDEKENYTRVERVAGSFYRRFTLPEDADAENISAQSKNGVLEIRIPKQEQAQPHKIAVQH
ncbi:MAG: Hsp20/alpha crystallin family protein [Gammaproteobacteria bacterium]